ncbi:MAG: tRNA 2-thiocytidine(32) synthetase TtcA [Deltaproteobacteria bacterium]|nr:tRNA 2-thiocytidine(32) synthetase TtcA [Deltaproteobacteria bacterium]
MISHGDRIAVGVSGGMDSLFLLWILSERLNRIPIDYELFPIHIEPGFDGGFDDELDAYCTANGHFLKVDHTNYGVLSHSDANRENPCFLCARLRRKRLFELADEMGCDKLALGHNKDDLIETFFLNVCYAGEISTMVPKQSFFDGKFTIIRPLAFADESSIRRFAREKSFPEFKNPCPSAGHSKRQEMKVMLRQLYQKNRKIKGNIFRALSHVKMDYLLR